jgi:DNA-binding NarL/FixJ family response regulator
MAFEAPPRRLSPRELAVLQRLVAGDSYKQAASELALSVDTVRGYIKSLYRKLGVHNVAGAVARAFRERLL